MHEASLMAALLRQITAIAQAQQAGKVVAVHVRLGALCHISPQHLRLHFAQAATGTVAEAARLDIVLATDIQDTRAQDVVLTGIEVEDEVTNA